MKIVDLKVHLAKEWRTFLFVEVVTDQGIIGVGEAGLTSRELAVAGALEHFRPLLLGEDAFRIEHIWQKLFRCGFYPAGPVVSAAISAIDLALWDIKGKALGVPVYQLLGGRTRDRLLTYCHLHGAGVEGVVAAARSAVADGWKALRWEPQYDADGCLDARSSVDGAIAQWHAVREAVGPDVALCFDVHTKWGVSDVIRFCNAVEPLNPYFVEDPVRSENPAVYEQLRQQTRVPLAAGEQFASKWQYKPLVEGRLIDFARLDLCIGGGITEARKIAGWCETNLIDISVHNPIGPISTAACLHFNISLPNFGVMELPRRPGECLADAVTGQPDWEAGYLLPNDRPGLGVELNVDSLAKYPFEMDELPHLHRPDGGFTNW